MEMSFGVGLFCQAGILSSKRLLNVIAYFFVCSTVTAQQRDL